MGCVYWITGLSGAGKTTIGKLLYQKVKDKEANTVFLDGDVLRKVFGDDLGYTKEDRKKCAMRYSRLCALLAVQGINVICCTISMFDSVREWNRCNIQDYREIYVKVPIHILQERNQKGLYSEVNVQNDINLVGVTYKMEEPKTPDLVLNNEGSLTPEEQIDIICHYWKI